MTGRVGGDNTWVERRAGSAFHAYGNIGQPGQLHLLWVRREGFE